MSFYKEDSKNTRLKKSEYPIKNIFFFYIVPEFCDEDLNIFEGFLFVKAEDKSEVSYLKTRYKLPVSGYTPRLAFILYDGHLLIKDYRRKGKSGSSSFKSL